MSDLIPTIKDGDNIQIFEEDSESEDETGQVFTKEMRKRKKAEEKGFNSNFVFDTDNQTEEISWSLDCALEMARAKQSNQSSLDHKIAEVRRNRLIKKAHFTPDCPDSNVVEEEASDEDEEQSMLVADKVKTKEVKFKKNTKRKNDEEFDDEIRKTIAEKKAALISEKDDSDEEFFINCPEWNPKLGFQDMNLSRPLLKGISVLNYVTPTPIQQAAIPVALLGKDICACAATGTGKTAAFMLPVLERLVYKPRVAPVTRILCLVPTRELAVQVHSITRQLAQFTDIQVCLAAGGLDRKSQEAALRHGPDIIVGTPGRVIDHLQNAPSFQIKTVEILILDEADRMLDEFFEDQMNEIIELCSPNHQTMLFSATMTDQVKDLAAVSLNNPTKIFINSNTEVAPFLRQEFIRIRPNKEGDREAIICALCSRTFVSNVLIFTQTKKQAHRMHIVMGLLGLKVGELHGDLNQAQRLESLQKFKNGEIDILVCTDIAARGLDISNVKTVINFTMPNTVKHYIHRVGRTARAGKVGRSVSLVGETERKMLKDIVKQAKNPVKSRIVPPGVIEKFKSRLEEQDEEIEEVIKMEVSEKELIKSENQISKGQKLLEKKTGKQCYEPQKRMWFQSHSDRENRKATLLLGFHSEVKGKKLKKGKKSTFVTRPRNAEERAAHELEKVKAYQLRETKRNRKPKRARACAENNTERTSKRPKLKNKSSFESELTNTGRHSVKKFRSGPNYQDRMAMGLGPKGKQRKSFKKPGGRR